MMNMKLKVQMKRFAVAVAAYVLLLITAVFLSRTFSLSQTGRVLLPILPVLPTLYAVWVFAGAIGEMDELHQLIQLQALAFSFGATAVLVFTYGLLQAFAGLPAFNLSFLLAPMCILWAGALFFLTRRYG
jgi:surface polysaccharide O-acyltransferase-like enzyme